MTPARIAELREISRSAFAATLQELWGDSDNGPWSSESHEAMSFEKNMKPLLDALESRDAAIGVLREGLSDIAWGRSMNPATNAFEALSRADSLLGISESGDGGEVG